MTTSLATETEEPCSTVAARAGATKSTRASRSFHAIPEGLILAALVVVMVAQLWTSVTKLSITSDEIDHLHAGYRYLQCNDFGWNPEHPPLVKIVAALPLMAMPVFDPMPNACGLYNSKNYDFVVGHEFIFKNPERMLTTARWAASIFSVLLLATAWFCARKMFGLPVAIIAGVLVAFDPNLLANGALVTTDVAASLAFLLVVYALYRYCNAPNGLRLLALGGATGFALCVKYSTILLVIILPALLALDALSSDPRERGRKLLRHAGVLLVVAAIAFTIIWACYGFRYAARPGGAAVWTPPRLPAANGTVSTKVIPALRQGHVLPEGYLVGLQDVLVNSEVGPATFLWGRYYHQAIWFYYPAAITIKYTLPVLLMIVLSALAWRFWRDKRKELLFLLLPVAIYLMFSMSTKQNIGSRHALPILPLLIIFAAAGTWAFLGNRKQGVIVVLILLAFDVGSSLHAYPNYLSYSNELWGGPAETYRYLAYSDDDWGQAQKMARDYVLKTHPVDCFTIRPYHNLNRDYGIPCRGISEDQWDPLPQSFTGTMLISGDVYDGMYITGSAAVRIFKDRTPVAKLGGSALLVFDGTFDMRPLVAVQRLVTARNIGDQDAQAALALAQEAAELDPASGDAHVEICAALVDIGDLGKAEEECNLGLDMVRRDPQYGPRAIQNLRDFITRKGLPIHEESAQRP